MDIKQKEYFSLHDSNVLKGMGILLMLFHHLFNDYEEYAGYTVSYAPFSGDRLMALAIAGKICVAMFLFVTGYGITAQFTDRFGAHIPSPGKIGRFIWKRYYKLMCGYWVVFLLTLICQPLGRTVMDAWGSSIKGILCYGVIDFAGLAWFFSTPTLNPTWWYMSVAIAAVIILPLVICLMNRYGSMIVTAVIMLLVMILRADTDAGFYVFTALLGAVSFRERFFERTERHISNKPGRRIIAVLIAMTVLAILIYMRNDLYYFGIIEGFIALTMAFLARNFFSLIPGLSRGLEVLGKYSLNMFLFHNQLYSFYFTGLFYSARHWLLIVFALTAVSFGVSVFLEWIKKKTRYIQRMNDLAKNIVFKWLGAHPDSPD